MGKQIGEFNELEALRFIANAIQNGTGEASAAVPGGSTTQIQFNDAGAFGGDAGLTYNKTTDALTVAGRITVQGGTLGIQTSTGTAFGISAGATKVAGATGSDDLFVGYLAGQLVPDGQSFHTFLGAYAGAVSASGSGGTAVGQKAFASATSIGSSVAVGSKAGNAVIAPTLDTFVGYAANQFGTLTGAGGRTYVGYGAGQYDNGNRNVNIGYLAGSQNSGSPNPVTGSDNIAIGTNALDALSGGTLNIALGQDALGAITSGSYNIALGYHAGYSVTAGGSNIYIGYEAGKDHTAANCTFIGVMAGNSLPVNSQNFFVAGSSGNNRMEQVYFGKGYSDATPTGYTINGTGGSGSNIAAGDVTIAGGKGTGTGVGGRVVLSTAPAGASSSTLNALVERLIIGSTGLVSFMYAGTTYYPHDTAGVLSFNTTP